MADFDRAFDIIVGVEGEFSLDPNDPGNWTGGKKGVGELKGTRWGISAKSYPHLDIKNLTKEQAKAIYRKDYWDQVKGDQYRWPLNLFVFDSAVNQGVDTAIRTLQDAFNLTVDGKIGPNTLNAAQRAGEWHTANYMAVRAKKYTTTASYDKYGEGWFTRLFSVAMKA